MILAASGRGTRLEMAKKVHKNLLSLSVVNTVSSISLWVIVQLWHWRCRSWPNIESVQLNSYVAQSQRWVSMFKVLEFLSSLGKNWRFWPHKGTADAILKILILSVCMNLEYVLILSGDHIYKWTMINFWIPIFQNNAGCNHRCYQVPIKEASVWYHEHRWKLSHRSEEKPANPKSNLASMGFISSPEISQKYLQEDDKLKPLHMTSAMISFQNIWQMVDASTHIHSVATGRTWVLSTVSGNPTWTWLITPVIWIYQTLHGKSTPKTLALLKSLKQCNCPKCLYW